MIMDVLVCGIKYLSMWCILFANDIVLCSTRREEFENKREEWIRSMEDRRVKISRKNTMHLRFYSAFEVL